jgi:disintegrin and metalloproteinase domain-containing protein 17
MLFACVLFFPLVAATAVVHNQRHVVTPLPLTPPLHLTHTLRQHEVIRGADIIHSYLHQPVVRIARSPTDNATATKVDGGDLDSGSDAQEDLRPFAPHSKRRLEFKAYNTSFALRLVPNARLFRNGLPSVTVLSGKGERDRQRLTLDAENYMRGSMEGVPGSHVSLYIRADGGFLGRIDLPQGDSFFFEPAVPHYGQPHTQGGDVLVYTARDIKPDGWRKGHTSEEAPSFCGHHSAGEAYEGHTHTDDRDHDHDHDRSPQDEATWSSFPSPSHPSSYPPLLGVMPQRPRREAASSTFNTCLMTVVSDFRFYSFHGRSVADATAAMIQHIEAADQIYRRTSFDDQTGLGLGVRAVTVFSSRDADPFIDRSDWPVTDLLQAFSSSFDFSTSCLAHLFTRIDFDGGTLGLAWVASPSASRAGGICHAGDARSLNTGLSTNINFASNVPFLTSALVLAHEIGHNWGAEHDVANDATCSPTSGGKFIMHPVAVSGSDANNDEFSPCSRAAMAAAVRAKGNCFSVPPAAICGNGIVEQGGDDGNINTLDDNEECDTGGIATACCTADCKFTDGSVCAPENNDCCNSATCNGYARADNVTCFQSFAFDEGCRLDGVCTTSNGRIGCEEPLGAKAEGAVCGNGGRCSVPAVLTTDYDSRCVSLCQRLGARECTCTGVEEECKSCCRDDPGAVCDASNCNCPFRRANNGSCSAVADVLTEALQGSANPECWRDVASDPETAFANDPPLDDACDPSQGDVCQRITHRVAGVPCSRGACNRKGVCAAIDTNTARFWDGIGNLSIDDLRRWAYNNIVGAVILVVFILWCPVSCCVSRYDHNMRKKDPIYGMAHTTTAARQEALHALPAGGGGRGHVSRSKVDAEPVAEKSGPKARRGAASAAEGTEAARQQGRIRAQQERMRAQQPARAGHDPQVDNSAEGRQHRRPNSQRRHFHSDGRAYTQAEEEAREQKREARRFREFEEACKRKAQQQRRPLTREELVQLKRERSEEEARAWKAQQDEIARARTASRSKSDALRQEGHQRVNNADRAPGADGSEAPHPRGVGIGEGGSRSDERRGSRVAITGVHREELV